jgi:CheY-like chemotaxis protein
VAKVLVVDDDEVIVRLLELNFELEGHEVASVLDGKQAIERIAEVAPDVVLLDVMMPELDGYRVCAQLREDPAFATLPIVFLSARAQETDIARGTEVGGDAYVTKPFDPLELVQLVERLVAERRP